MRSRRSRTAGFSTKANSIEAFAPATQWVVILFMVLGGINFALMYRALVRRQPRAASRDEELRLYLALLALGALLLIVEIWTEDVVPGWDAVREGVFTAVSTMTTTGYSVADYNTWPRARADDDRRAHVRGRIRGLDDGFGEGRPPRAARQDPSPRDRPDAASGGRPARPAQPNRRRRAHAAALSRRSSFSTSGSSSSAQLVLAIDAARTGARAARRSTRSPSPRACSRTSGRRSESAGRSGRSPRSATSRRCVMIGLMWLGRLEIVPIVVLVSRHYWRNA